MVTKGKKLIVGEDVICPKCEGFAEKFDTQDQKTNTVIVKLDALKEQITKQFTLQEQAVNAALVAADRAVSKAEAASEKRFDSVNEFRATLADQQRSLMPRMETETLFKNMTEKIEAITDTLVDKIGVIEKNLSVDRGQKSGKREGAAAYMIIVSLIFSFISATAIIIHMLR
jgi:transglutaminase/protease-like cytokinesis protein 3